MKKKSLWITALGVSCLSTWAEPGGSYTLTGEEKGVEEIIKADMGQYPDLYKGVNFRRYLSEFKKKNNIGKLKFLPGDIFHFPDTAASLSVKNNCRADCLILFLKSPISHNGLSRSKGMTYHFVLHPL